MTFQNKISYLILFAFSYLILFAFIALCGYVAVRDHQPCEDLFCGTDEIVETVDEVQDETKRTIRKIWIAPGTVHGITETAFRNRIKRCLNALSSFTNTDFEFVDHQAGSHTQIYPATNEMMWVKKPQYRKDKLVPLGMQNGSWIYLASEILPVSKRERWGQPSDLILEACVWHEWGHRIGLSHTSDKTSIMHGDLPVRKLNPTDIKNYQQKMGKR
jgi:hypothetical protein